MPFDVSESEFARLVEEGIAALPDQFRRAIEEDVPVEARDRPSVEMLESVGLGRNDLLLGLYRGINVMEQSVEHSGVLPACIYLFREDIEDASRDRADFVEQVRVTLLHELGHHFGLDEDDLEGLGYG